MTKDIEEIKLEIEALLYDVRYGICEQSELAAIIQKYPYLAADVMINLDTKRQHEYAKRSALLLRANQILRDAQSQLVQAVNSVE